jgi:hypothetical protein
MIELPMTGRTKCYQWCVGIVFLILIDMSCMEINNIPLKIHAKCYGSVGDTASSAFIPCLCKTFLSSFPEVGCIKRILNRKPPFAKFTELRYSARIANGGCFLSMTKLTGGYIMDEVWE